MAATNFPRLGEPTSSSPSIQNLILFCSVLVFIHCFQCFYMHVKLAFIIATATGKNFTIFNHRFKRAAIPKFQWIGGLHIIMAVNQHRWFGRDQLFFRHTQPDGRRLDIFPLYQHRLPVVVALQLRHRRAYRVCVRFWRLHSECVGGQAVRSKKRSLFFSW